jgi:hypothetical protein
VGRYGNEREAIVLVDWIGNAQAVHAVNQRNTNSAENDYYATDPRAVELLLEHETFAPYIWEPACGEGHMVKVLKQHEYSVFATDLIDRGCGLGGEDFLNNPYFTSFDGDIITNPPYKYAKEFVEQALRIVLPGRKVAMFLKLTFLEGQGRRDLFRNNPPQTVYVSSARLECGKNGVFTGQSAVAYCWVVWRKGHTGSTNIEWIN